MKHDKPEVYIPPDYKLKTYDMPYSPFSSPPSTPDAITEEPSRIIKAVEHYDSDGSPYIEHESANEFPWREDREEVEKEFPSLGILNDGNFVFTL